MEVIGRYYFFLGAKLGIVVCWTNCPEGNRDCEISDEVQRNKWNNHLNCSHLNYVCFREASDVLFPICSGGRSTVIGGRGYSWSFAMPGCSCRKMFPWRMALCSSSILPGSLFPSGEGGPPASDIALPHAGAAARDHVWP